MIAESAIINGSAFIPLRGVFENIGSKVTWNEADQSIDIERNGTKVHLQIGSTTVQVNGQSYQIETAPFISSEGSTYVPIRFISETIGAKVGWDANN